VRRPWRIGPRIVARIIAAVKEPKSDEKARAQKRGGHVEFVFLDHDSAEIQYRLASEELSAVMGVKQTVQNKR
jgi:hypothetical protein